MSRAEEIEAIRAEYPKHSKAAFSLASRPEETGVTFTAKAAAILRELRGPKKDGHIKTHRLSVRVTESRWRLVKRLIEEDGRFVSVNAWLDWWVFVWITNKERAKERAAGAGTPNGSDENNAPAV